MPSVRVEVNLPEEVPTLCENVISIGSTQFSINLLFTEFLMITFVKALQWHEPVIPTAHHTELWNHQGPARKICRWSLKCWQSKVGTTLNSQTIDSTVSIRQNCCCVEYHSTHTRFLFWASCWHQTVTQDEGFHSLKGPLPRDILIQYIINGYHMWYIYI